MRQTDLVPIQVYELLLIYQVLGEMLVAKFCYQAETDFQAVRDALDHVNTIAEAMGVTVVSLEVFCVELGFRGMDPDEPDLIVNRHDRQIYDSRDLDTSLVEELPLRMEGKVA